VRLGQERPLGLYSQERMTPKFAIAILISLAAAACTTPQEAAQPPESGDSALVETAAPPGDLPVLRSESLGVAETTTTVQPSPEPSIAPAMLAQLTTEEKVGQLFMPVVVGNSATDVTPAEAQANTQLFGVSTPAEVVDRFHLGGIIYLTQNIKAANQVGAFSAGLQDSAGSVGSGIGLLIAVDQEGGRVNRITDGVTVFPPAALLSGDTDAVREAGYLTGTQVAVQGVNVVLAPVADVTATGAEGAIGNRSYGDNPAVVSEMVRAAIDGIQGSGVAAAVKHWPGHGSTRIDSHENLPVLDISRSEWEQRDQVPFRAAIDEDVAIVLVGHLALPSVDPDGDPAIVSSVLIDEILRGDLGFDGVVMTDALNMGAVAGFNQAELSVNAVLAGADILLVPPDLPASYAAVLSAVGDGRISAERLDDATLRVLNLKEQLGLLPIS